MKIVVGICARNEESSIILMLDSLLPQVLNDPDGIEFHVLICANGCTDQTIPLIKLWQAKNKTVFSRLFILDEASLIEAQRKIVEESKKMDVTSVIFLDADIILDRYCLNELVKNSLDKNIKAAYALSVPILRKRQSLVEKTLNLYDTPSNILSKRKHLHGRAFLINVDSWNMPHTNPKLIADVIYLSFYLLKNYGPESIKNILTSRVYFNQVATYSDFYKAFYRRSIEIRKVLNMFPDFNNLPKDQVNRIFLWENLSKEPVNKIFLWLFWIFLKKLAIIQFKIESIIKFYKNDQWSVTKTSKMINPNKKPILVLIEGLDCSGKKTTASRLQKTLTDIGITSVINIGPLKSKIYRSLASFVSLHRAPNFLRSCVYAFDGIGDRKWYKSFSSDVVIQISSPMRNWSYSIVNKKYIRIFVMHIIKNKMPNYDLIWYLTVPYKTRLERHVFQVKDGKNPDRIEDRFPGEDVFNKMEITLKKILSEQGKIQNEFDTTVTSYEEIVIQIIDKIKIL